MILKRSIKLREFLIGFLGYPVIFSFFIFLNSKILSKGYYYFQPIFIFIYFLLIVIGILILLIKKRKYSGLGLIFSFLIISVLPIFSLTVYGLSGNLYSRFFIKNENTFKKVKELSFNSQSDRNSSSYQVQMTVDANKLIISDGNLNIYDITQADNPLIIKSVLKISSALAINNNYYFVASPGEGLLIYDFLDINNPKKISQLKTKGIIKNLVFFNQYLYLLDSQEGIIVLNVSDPVHPERISDLKLNLKLDDKSDLDIYNNYLFVTTSGHLNIIEISSSQTPVLVNEIEEELFDLAVGDNKLYLSNTKGIKIYDFSNPRELKQLKLIKRSWGSGLMQNFYDQLFLDKNILYTTADSNEIGKIDVSDSLNFKYRDSLRLESAPIQGIYKINNYLYLIDSQENKLIIVKD